MVSNWAESATGPRKVVGSRGEFPRPREMASKVSLSVAMRLVEIDS